jgi:hypothetical protein
LAQFWTEFWTLKAKLRPNWSNPWNGTTLKGVARRPDSAFTLGNAELALANEGFSRIVDLVRRPAKLLTTKYYFSDAVISFP